MAWFKPAWEKLTAEERDVLDCFYADDDSGAVYTICNRYGIERTSAYKKKNRALDKFVIQLYGKQ